MSTPAERYAEALVAERRAWALVNGKPPGSPNHSPELWELWQATVVFAEDAKAAMAEPGQRSGEGIESVIRQLARKSQPKQGDGTG